VAVLAYDIEVMDRDAIIWSAETLRLSCVDKVEGTLVR